ncbi:MAG: hypothetical protein CMJ89_15880 [Planctomycetes bacterium]|jgi:hypothetical protein|nr:hypothetical protein [Planctomycetota bacterium]
MMSLIQVASLLCVALIVQAFPSRNGWISVMASSTFSHYILAVLYARPKILSLGSDPRYRLPLLIVALIGATAYLSGFPIVIFFGLHHAFNEVYLLDRQCDSRELPGHAKVRTADLFTRLFVYFTIVRHHNHMTWIADELLFAGLAASSLAYVYLLICEQPSITRALRTASFQLIGLAMVAVSFFADIEFLMIVLYHVVFWIFYPLMKISKAGASAITRYLVATFGITAIFLLISPLSALPFSLTAEAFNHQLVVWAFVHITLSLPLSTAHPEWIVRWFRPRLREASQIGTAS